METIIVALISGLCVAVPSVFSTILSNKKNNDLINYKIEELTKQVEKHNKVIERVYKLEKDNALEEEKIKELEKNLGKVGGQNL